MTRSEKKKRYDRLAELRYAVWSSEWKNRQSKGGEFMDEAKKLVVLEQENEELKRELRELSKTLDQMNQSLNRMIDHYILCKTEKAG